MQLQKIRLPGGVTIRDPGGDRYVVESLLGEGGFSAVYLVRDRRDKQNLFALKEVIDPNKPERERFIFEGEILRQLDHKALPRVYQVFENDKLKRVYLLMDYIKGKDLEALREEQPDGRFSLPLVLALLSPVVDALIYLHHQNPPIVHRDIKPANIIVPTGANEAVLVDFGSAKQYVAAKTTTVIRHGSPGYAALEQYGGGTTPRTDIYGLGATLYTLLTGTVPIDAVIRAAGSKGVDPLEPASLITPDVPTGVARTLQRAMSISSYDRFATIEEFWQELTAPAPQEQEDMPHISLPETPLPLPPAKWDVSTTPLNKAQDVRPLDIAQDVRHVRKRRALWPIISALLLVIIIGISSLSYLLVHSSSSAPHKAILPTTHSTPLSTATSGAFSPTPTFTQRPSNYPAIAASYGGTIKDLFTKTKTAMFLTNVQQKQNNIHGSFSGLDLIGPFKGTVTAGGNLQFTVTIYQGNMTLSFEGTIKIGGDIVGTFKVLDQHGNFTGEYGEWNISSNP